MIDITSEIEYLTQTQRTPLLDGWMDEREIWSVSRRVAAKNIFQSLVMFWLVHGQVTIIFVVSVGLSVCLFVCAEFFSAVFDPISVKLGHMLYI